MVVLTLDPNGTLKSMIFITTDGKQRKSILHSSLIFEYQGTEILWNDSRKKLDLARDNQVISFKRHKKIENRAHETLSHHGLTPLEKLPEYNQYRENSESMQFFGFSRGQSDPLNFSFKGLPKLREQGWEILIDADYPYQIIDESIDDWYGHFF